MGDSAGSHPPRLLLVITEDWYYWSHRRSIARAALAAGYEVTLASRFTDHRQRIEADGVRTVDVRLRRSGRNPVGEVAAIVDLARLYRRLRPDVVHHVALKPVLYGSWAARLTGVDGVVNAVSGLG
jgi:nucleoside-diphosphate-sugar epimerase